MPRRHSRRPTAAPRSTGTSGGDRVEERGGRRWNVRRLHGSQKSYVCPACHRDVTPGTAHVLVWPVEKSLLSADAIDERRHWHLDCWTRLGGR